MIVRKYLHSEGFRYRLHRKNLPGKPDIVLPKYKTAIFVNGCFWHRHSCKKGRSIPSSNTKFWMDKFEANITRDMANQIKLKEIGWNPIVIWECEIKNGNVLKELIVRITSNGKMVL